MKKKQGFTLIELLAVIVVLAIIALIATPIVMNTINSAKKSAAERGAENYVRAVELALANEYVTTKDGVADGEYKIDEYGNIEINGKTITVDVKGNKPSSGTITIKNGDVAKTGTSLSIGEYTVEWDINEKISIVEEGKILCKASKTLSNSYAYSVTIWNPESHYVDVEGQIGYLSSEKGAYAQGVEYTCNLGDSSDAKNVVFYVVESDEDSVSLIMGKKLTNSVWCSYNDYIESGGTKTEWDSGNQTKFGPVTANKAIANNTTSWTKISPSQISLPTKSQVENVDWFGVIDNYNFTNFLLKDNDNHDVLVDVAAVQYIIESANHKIYIQHLRADGCHDDSCAGHDSWSIYPVITIPKSQLG